MIRRSQAGQSLAEVAISVAIVATVLAALAGGVLASTRRLPALEVNALERAARSEARIAVDILKYRGGSIIPNTIATSVPANSTSTVPAHVSITNGLLPGGGIQVVVTVTSDRDSSKSATVTETIAEPAPVPSSTVSAPSPVPAPTGAR